MNNQCIKFFKQNPVAKRRLFCFPYAGGGSLIFRNWHEYIAPDIEIACVKLQGRDDRIKEPLFNNIFRLTEKLEEEIRSFLDKPFAFFGHSMGSLIAFELARTLRKKKAPLPFHFFASGRRAPQIKPDPPIHHLPEEQFKEKMCEYGGTPEEVLGERDLLDIFLPILRADFCLNDTYIYKKEKPLECPITAFYGTKDKKAVKDAVAAWKEQTSSHFNIHAIEGGHFFLNDQPERILNIVSADKNPHSKGDKMKAYIFPGQGSQKKGMGDSLFDEFSDITKKADEILGYSIKELCLNDPQKQLGQTNYTQPALYVVNALTWLKKISTGEKPDFLAGHSLGEYNALFAAGTFDFETGLKLVQERSRLMALAKGGGMAAVIGLDDEKVNSIIKENNFSAISVANYNSQDQVVISGIKSEIEKAEPVFKKARAKLYIILQVSGAFHSKEMEAAKKEFADFIEKFEFKSIEIPVISNVTAREYDSKKIKELLCGQITSPVKWSESVRYIMGKGEIEFEEIGPGNVLTNLIKKIKTMPPIKEKKQEKKEEKKVEKTEKTAQQTQSPKIAKKQEEISLITSLSLGNAEFKKEYGLKYAYVTGAMVRGIASEKLVTAVCEAGMMGFFGTGGLEINEVEKIVIELKKQLGDKSFGMNFLHHPVDHGYEEAFTDMLLKHNVKNIEAAAFMQITPALVRYRVSGIKEKDGKIELPNKIMGKISRPETAKAFLMPPPEKIIKNLLQSGKITEDQAKLAAKIPMADALCAEADSGGHTDIGQAFAIFPAISALKDSIVKQQGYQNPIFVGSAGGIGTPQAAAAAFILGADFILTGSINQCTVEAGISDIAKDMLSQMNVQDTDYAPAGDMFEFGAKVQVLKKGTFFPARANKLYNIYTQFDSIDSIDEKTKSQIEKQYFKKSFEQVYSETKEFFAKTDPSQIEKAEKNSKHKMALIFRWYFWYSTNAALQGKAEDKVNFQIHTGPALGAFNQWVKRTELEDWRNRHVAEIGIKIMEATANLLNKRIVDLSER